MRIGNNTLLFGGDSQVLKRGTRPGLGRLASDLVQPGADCNANARTAAPDEPEAHQEALTGADRKNSDCLKTLKSGRFMK